MFLNLRIEWKSNHDNNYYTKCFQEQVLDSINQEQVLKDLFFLSKGKDVVLVCHEKYEESMFCHRILVSDWLNSIGIKVTEWRKTQ